MTKGGKESKAVAQAPVLPAGNAVETGGTFDIISVIFMGPELEGETLETDEDQVIGKVTGSPIFNAHKSIGNEPTAETPAHYQAFCQNLVESSNPRYTMRCTKRICTEDSYYEYSIKHKK